MLGSGPFDLEHNQPKLRKVTEEFHQMMPTAKDSKESEVKEERGEQKPVLSKIDVTRDLAGAFYAQDNWREKHKELTLNLKKNFGVDWRDNGNSFNSCF